jgi:autotransporter strand-loop-strand O-heptosyltransferase
MEKIKIYAHGSYVGTTGFNNHTRDFFRHLKKHLDIKVRNFTVGKFWTGFSQTPHDKEDNLSQIDKDILYKQTLWGEGRTRTDEIIYPSPDKDFNHDFNLVLSETNHYYFYDHYVGPKIGYNVWESTLQPEDFFDKLKSYDELWVPSKWQRDCMINQGYEKEKIQVVPEGVDSSVFFPEEVSPLDIYKDGRFKFLLFGRWDYRKSIREVIESFLKTFDPSEPVDLIVSIDNPWGESVDGMKTTEERLEYHGLSDPRIKVLHFPSREDYIKILKTGHVFVSCARSEGWNLPLIEAMACGTPSIYSNCSGQLEFAEGKGIPVKILGERSTTYSKDAKYSIVVTTSSIPGNYYEPDFDDLSESMRKVYSNYQFYKDSALRDSEEIRRDFSWERVGEIGYQKCLDFYKKIKSPGYTKKINPNSIRVSYLDGPKVEITGDILEKNSIEFLDDSGEVVYSTEIKTNMWTTCSRKYFTKWKIRVNGKIVDEFDPRGKRVLIALESKSLGDTIAWSPYAIEFAKKNKCKVILSTFHNYFFEGLAEYKDIEFMNPGNSTDCYAVYRIGWFRDNDGGWKNFSSHPLSVNTVPLQKTSSDILGLEYKEINFGVNLKKRERPVLEKYVVFAPQSTAGCKEWSYDHWSSLSKLVQELGYKVVIPTKDPYYLEGCINVWGESLETVANYLHHADAFVGLTSGLSWLNWAIGKHTYVIDGLSRDWFLFQENSTKIYNNNVCIFCGNDEVFSFDAGDWDWCPVYKGTQKQHICQKSITPLQVFNKMKI